MALTGELPPDANRGKNFVHDPKVQANTETKAAIKMQFQTVNGKVRTVCRRSTQTFYLVLSEPRCTRRVEVHCGAAVHASVQDAEGGRRAKLQHEQQ